MKKYEVYRNQKEELVSKNFRKEIIFNRFFFEIKSVFSWVVIHVHSVY